MGDQRMAQRPAAIFIYLLEQGEPRGKLGFKLAPEGGKIGRVVVAFLRVAALQQSPDPVTAGSQGVGEGDTVPNAGGAS